MGRANAEQRERSVDPKVRGYYAGMLGYPGHFSNQRIQDEVRATLMGLSRLVHTENPDPRAVAEYQILTHRLEIVLGKAKESNSERRQREETERLRGGIPHPRSDEHDRSSATSSNSSSSSKRTYASAPEGMSFDAWLAQQRSSANHRRFLRRVGVPSLAVLAASTFIGVVLTTGGSGTPSGEGPHPLAQTTQSATVATTSEPTGAPTSESGVPTSESSSPDPVVHTTHPDPVLTWGQDCGIPVTDATIKEVQLKQFDCRYPNNQLVRVYIYIYADGSRKYLAENSKVTISAGDPPPQLPVGKECVVFPAPGNTSVELKCP